ncbi:hypothetical protein BD310DRAFT_942463 [Dichomitus squalens]|uniref:Uncharacterized protein n=1 Tax=Dichomitus squalens TaxID=114155 RepID=A0A4Q9PA05_9APHY|nr:hypothetical protein BD310DRAFT_942463 [Dichomitus squalens]
MLRKLQRFSRADIVDHFPSRTVFSTTTHREASDTRPLTHLISTERPRGLGRPSRRVIRTLDPTKLTTNDYLDLSSCCGPSLPSCYRLWTAPPLRRALYISCLLAGALANSTQRIGILIPPHPYSRPIARRRVVSPCYAVFRSRELCDWFRPCHRMRPTVEPSFV